MDYLQGAAEKYLKSQFGGEHGSSSGGLDWSNLSNLANNYSDADSKTDGELDANTFKQHLSGFASKYGFGGEKTDTERPSGGFSQAQQAYAGGGEHSSGSHGAPPPGYPGSGSSKPSSQSAPAGANPDIIHQLLEAFTKETGGEKFTGSSGQYQFLSQLATKLTGQNIPVPILEKLIKWKLNGLV